MNDASRAQGWAICGGAALLALLFLIGVLSGSYLALAIPVSILTLFALGLAAWVGYTIATIHVEIEPDPLDAPTPQGESVQGDRSDSAS